MSVKDRKKWETILTKWTPVYGKIKVQSFAKEKCRVLH